MRMVTRSSKATSFLCKLAPSLLACTWVIASAAATEEASFQGRQVTPARDSSNPFAPIIPAARPAFGAVLGGSRNATPNGPIIS